MVLCRSSKHKMQFACLALVVAVLCTLAPGTRVFFLDIVRISTLLVPHVFSVDVFYGRGHVFICRDIVWILVGAG